MTELIFCENGSLGHASGSAVSGGVFNILNSVSQKVKTENYGVYRGFVSFTFTLGNASGFVDGSVQGVGLMSPSATKTKADSLLVMREGDSLITAFTGTPTGGGSPIAVPGSNGVEVVSAGQTKVRAD